MIARINGRRGITQVLLLDDCGRRPPERIAEPHARSKAQDRIAVDAPGDPGEPEYGHDDQHERETEPVPGLTLDKFEPRLTRGRRRRSATAAAAMRSSSLEKPPRRRLASMRVVPIKTRRGGNLQ